MEAKYKEKIVNVQTGEETWRDYTAEEIAALETAQAEANDKAAKAAVITEQRAALLERLGLSEEEAKLLLG